MTYEQCLHRIDEKLLEIKLQRPLTQGELRELQKSLKVAFTYHSNAVEGSTITLGETKILLEDGLTVGGKSVREIAETLNHNAIFDLLYDLVNKKEDINVDIIKKIHELVLRNIDDENAGKYRRIQVRMSGDEKLPPNALGVPKLMEEFIMWYELHKQTLHPVELAGRLHYTFVKIHPFIDGNGRTARILSNIILMQHGYPLVILPVSRRADCIQALHSTSSQQLFLEFFASIVLENLKDYLRMIDPEAR